MPIVSFARAARKGSHVLIALYGESGSGKTYSAILLARGLVGPEGKVAMLDTETGRGLIYANLAGGYDYAELTPPFTPERYIEAIKTAEQAGYDALIIDSASHEWEGIGGVVETADASNLQGLIKWASPKARHKKFVQALLTTRMHLILCLRAKEKMVQEGKTVRSEGFVSVQDKRFIFETTVQCFMPNTKNGNRGVPVVEKCPEDLMPAFPPGAKIGVKTGEVIREWVNGGAPVDHGLETLRREAEEAAEGGSKAFAAWWNRDDVKPRRDHLRAHLDNLKSIAKTADEEAERIRFKPVERSDEGEEDPFGHGRGAPSNDPTPEPEPEPPPKRTFPMRDGKADFAAYQASVEDEIALATEPAHIDAVLNREVGLIAAVPEPTRKAIMAAAAKRKAALAKSAA